MKIVNNTKEEHITIKDIDAGIVFEYNKGYYVKTDGIEYYAQVFREDRENKMIDAPCYVVELSSGHLKVLPAETLIKTCNAELHLNEKIVPKHNATDSEPKITIPEFNITYSYFKGDVFHYNGVTYKVVQTIHSGDELVVYDANFCPEGNVILVH